ncbi:MAG TPA: hypothetical protein PKD99_02290 [Sphingopyxis sp.]|mgnify:CR=1 FL=1|nr:hypothetical protein [Sphingopyxis sp.]HMP43906.1 hypothetical protein [Sphingopyxis sp.]HMQ18073.1 hypothetical protein [Sphingopyxis sp.]
MADLVITAANVRAGNGSKRRVGVAGATITPGQPVYLDPADDRYKLADCDGAAALRSPRGIALSGAANGQPLFVHASGPITIGATLAPGTAYYLSDTPGGICPVGDLSTGDSPVLLGIATSATVLDFQIQESGVEL